MAKKMAKKISQELLQNLACPVCKGGLTYDKKNNELVCFKSKLAYKIIDGILTMLIEEARKID